MMGYEVTSFDVLLFKPDGVICGTEVSKPEQVSGGVLVDGVGVLIICGRQHY